MFISYVLEINTDGIPWKLFAHMFSFVAGFIIFMFAQFSATDNSATQYTDYYIVRFIMQSGVYNSRTMCFIAKRVNDRC